MVFSINEEENACTVVGQQVMERRGKMSWGEFTTHKVDQEMQILLFFFYWKQLSFYFSQYHLEMFGFRWNAVHLERYILSSEIQS